MKPRQSSLNPYAAAYVPVSKRDANANASARFYATEEENNSSQDYDGTAWFQPPQYAGNNVQLLKNNPQRLSPGKSQPGSSSYFSSQQSVAPLADKHFMDEEVDIDLEYLRMTFPGISDESLVDVYNVNGGDLDAAVDMLSQLEFDDAVDSSGNLPDSLDIGDVSEPALPANSPSSKQKNATAEASTSFGHL
ncbi:polyadenylate-binding protein-interacting protein 5-like [Vicia villosa]|uniref:polyadenylate-binding protein-interacting protein 5-like n=1 Tax=Vicia villosa TaxID=3911 RepID=UPI00273CAD64|nr:polyadenylate-binding protein-interacting protein 5-like [Vicia villosa]XP_058724826.1 polyadenylate-binding protein-interacting protein 5-like [Vicia villosa]